MKIKSIVGEIRGLRCVRFVATINKSVKLQIPRRYQKTWSLKTVAPEYTEQEMLKSATEEAKRWEIRVMEKIRKAQQSTTQTNEDHRTKSVCNLL